MLTAPYQKARPHWPVILLLVAIKLLLPVLLQHDMYELQRDEYLYYQQGQHLSAGFLENPPLIALVGTITAWMGGAEWMLKLWPLIFGALTVILTCLIAAEFGGNRFAQFLAGFGMHTDRCIHADALFISTQLPGYFFMDPHIVFFAAIHQYKTKLLFVFAGYCNSYWMVQ